MQTHGSTNKSPNKLSVTKNKLTRWFVYEWGKPTWQKPPPSDFKATTPKISLLSQQAVTSKGEILLLSQQVVTSKGIPVLYTNL